MWRVLRLEELEKSLFRGTIKKLVMAKYGCLYIMVATVTLAIYYGSAPVSHSKYPEVW